MRMVIAAAAALLLAACASSTSDVDFDARDMWIAKVKTAEVRTVGYSRIASWKVIDRKHVLIYVNNKRTPYLLTIAGSCDELRFVNALGFQTQMNNRIYPGDKIIARDQRCLIDRISPVTQEQLDTLPK